VEDIYAGGMGKGEAYGFLIAVYLLRCKRLGILLTDEKSVLIESMHFLPDLSSWDQYIWRMEGPVSSQ
jgi:hypothetical protein